MAKSAEITRARSGPANTTEEQIMRVIVDEQRCDAHGVCIDACPEVFALEDDDDVIRVLIEEPDESLREKVELAAQLCPKAAIRIEG
jgi:ferredoxin